MKIIILFALLFSSQVFAAAYIGGSYGLTTYGSDPLEKYIMLLPRGIPSVGFFGLGRDFVGVEGFYQSLSTSAKVKHDGGKYDLTTKRCCDWCCSEI